MAKSLPILLLLPLIVAWQSSSASAGIPAPAQFYDLQRLDHFDDRNHRTWTQRYYTDSQYFAGPGSPIFVIFGGEGAIEPSTGLLYPFVAQHLARSFQALVLQPEHRFYGSSQPIDPVELHRWRRRNATMPDPREQWLTYEQALADAVQLLQDTRRGRGCHAERSSPDYCPAIAVGGSYPGFLAAMARIIHPDVFDMAYAASAPVRFYTQQVSPPSAYYDHIANVADQAVPGCRAGVQIALRQVQQWIIPNNDDDDDNNNNNFDPSDVGVCPGTVPEYAARLPSSTTFWDELHMMIGYTFANMNMAYYPPSNTTALHRACETFLDDSLTALEMVRTVLVRELGNRRHNSHCFDMAAQRPAGPRATISSGDWSGVGTGPSGESWDYQTCTLCVETIGFNATSSGMFLDRPWSLEWLQQHCQDRFAVTPDPYQINRKWGLDKFETHTNASYILFTNGLQDGWSVSGIQHNVSATNIVALNFPNGAHHSDLSSVGPTDRDTPDVKMGFRQVQTLLATWLTEIRRLPPQAGSSSFASSASGSHYTDTDTQSSMR